MLIGTKQHTAGNKTRYEIDYDEWLDEGRTINQSVGFSAALVAGSTVTDVTVGTASVTASKLYFWVQGGSVNEAFTAQVQITDTLGEIVIDTVNFNVVSP